MEVFKKFDYFPKLSETVEVRKTSQGGLIFILFVFTAFILCLIEVFTLFLGDPISKPAIEKPNLTEKVRINLNISIYETPCEAVTLDLQDITGAHFEDLQQTIYKLELDNRGYIVDRSKFEVVQKLENKNFYPSHPIWERLTKSSSTSCYGAELYEGQECKTCQDVMTAYLQRGWPAPLPYNIAQCKGMKTMSPRVLTQDFGSNSTDSEFILDSLLKNENLPQFYLENSLFEFRNVKKGEFFSFDIMRKDCERPQNAFLEFSYLDYDSGEIKQVTTNPIFFKASRCKTSIPIKIESFKDTKLIAEIMLINDKQMSINVENGEIFKVKIFGEKLDANDFPEATFKLRSNSIKGRMLHAEMYGYNDIHPTMISPHEVQYFSQKMGTGCQVVGTMFINKVPGNFHIATHHKGMAMMHLPNQLTAHHKIHLLEFTREDDQITLGKYTKGTNALDGKEMHPNHMEDVQYYLKVMGSSYNHPIWGETKYYEFVAHEDVSRSQGKNLVLIEFKIEFDPISMKYMAGRESIAQFLVSLLAIIGGIFATSTLIDRVINK